MMLRRANQQLQDLGHRLSTMILSLLFLLLLSPPSPSCVVVATPAGNGYQSKKWRLPPWTPTYSMPESTIFMPCNDSGYHSVSEAVRYGLVDYDWSNAKQLWANTQPMDCQERLLEQADMVHKADPTTKIFVYRNAIKALNWFTSIREKLDDPQYAGWFIKFKDYKGPSSNHSYAKNVPACTYDKCSEFYHDQKQTPEYPHGDGTCHQECDCGLKPCGEYVFDFRNTSFQEWFIHDWVITNTTILHEGVWGLYLDDRFELWGVSEEDTGFKNDTGSTQQDMQDMYTAFGATMEKLYDAIVSQGGFAWQMFDDGPNLHVPLGKPITPPDQCAKKLRTEWCVDNSTADRRALRYGLLETDVLAQPTNLTAEFLLTRGDFAWLGYDFRGCKSVEYPRPDLWDRDYGTPVGRCDESGTNTGIFTREWTKASVSWNCNTGEGGIKLKQL